MDSILKDLELDINFGLTPKAKRYMNTLSAAVGELGISQASQPSMVAAVTHLHDQLQQSSIELGQSSESHDILSEQCNEVERITTQLLKLASSFFPLPQRLIALFIAGNSRHLNCNFLLRRRKLNLCRNQPNFTPRRKSNMKRKYPSNKHQLLAFSVVNSRLPL